jgi:broad specificity phosphatase PhoE
VIAAADRLTTHRIVLIRHGTPEIEADIPPAQWRLSAAGRDAARSLARHLRDYAFDCVTSSPQSKAIGTSEAIASELGGLPIEVDAGFSEHARSSVGFLSQNALDTAIAGFFNQPARLVFGEETADQAFARFSAALERALAKAARDTVVVTHGTILSLYTSRVTKSDPLPFWRALPMPAVIVLEAGGTRLLS